MPAAWALNDAGRMVATIWRDLPTRFAGIDIDVFVVMPNHLYGIVVLRDDLGKQGDVGTPLVGARLGAIIGAFKSITTVEYGVGARTHGWMAFRGRLWQRNYYEHVVRDEADLTRIRRYVDENPLRWDLDDEHPDRNAPPGDGVMPEP
jgi:putative transposase